MRRTYVLIGAAAVVLAVVLIAVSQLGGGGGGKKTTPTPGSTIDASSATALLDGIPQSGAAVGKATSPVTLVEVGDLQCPACDQWALTAFPGVVREYVRTGKVRLVFNGIAFIGDDSKKALRFALACGLQDRLWYAVDLLYENQGEENSGWVTDDLLRSVGNAIPGLDVDKAFADMSSQAVDDEINSNEDEAQKLDVRGTPTFAAARRDEPLKTFEVSDFSAEAMHPKLDELLSK